MDNADSSRPNILFVTPATPFSSRSGAEQRSALMYEALTLIGEVDILILGEGHATQPCTTPLLNGRVMIEVQKKGSRGLKRFRPDLHFSQTLEALLPRSIQAYDLVVGRYLWPISQLRIPANVRRIVDLDDFKYRYSREAGRSASVLATRIKKRFAHWLACRALPEFSAAFVVNALDHREITQLPTCLLPNIAYGALDELPASASCGPNLLFVGSLWYPPNAEGVDWFLAHVWPAVRRVIPQTQLTLIGAAPPEVRARWEQHAGVSAPGFVDNLEAAYRAAALAIVPIHIGGGSNIKVLEALGYGCPCIVTRLTAEAFTGQLAHRQHFLVADNAHQFIQLVMDVLQHPHAYRSMATAGYQAVRDAFSSPKFKAEVTRFVREVLN
jgi:glycosyltransferase involved in cell wall biosynthesis